MWYTLHHVIYLGTPSLYHPLNFISGNLIKWQWDLSHLVLRSQAIKDL